MIRIILAALFLVIVVALLRRPKAVARVDRDVWPEGVGWTQ